MTANLDPVFRNRGHEVSRLEAFSDVVFGFALTILVVSLEAPRTSRELLHVMTGFIPFGFCFFVFLQMWYAHHTFFRRYGLQDLQTHIINAALLFLVLAYVYPLKFLVSVWLGAFSGEVGLRESVQLEHVRTLFAIYGGGFAGVYALVALLYVHAYRQRETLALNAVELFDTRHSTIDNAGLAAIGLLSVIAAEVLPLRWVGASGYLYGLIGVWKWWYGTSSTTRRRQLAQSVVATT